MYKKMSYGVPFFMKSTRKESLKLFMHKILQNESQTNRHELKQMSPRDT